MQITLIPATPFVMGSEYKLKVNNWILTGDSIDTFEFFFKIHDKGSIIVNPISANTAITLDSSFSYPILNQPYTFALNDSLELYAPKSLGLWEFSHWSSSDISEINNLTANKLMLVIDSNLIKLSLVNPVYNKIITDTISIQSSDLEKFKVYNYWDYLGNGKYVIPRKNKEDPFIEFIKNDSIDFIKWISDDSLHNDNYQERFVFDKFKNAELFDIFNNNGKTIEIGPSLGSPAVLLVCNTYNICLELQIPKFLESSFVNINDYLEISLDNPELGLNNRFVENSEWQNVVWDANKGTVKFCYALDLSTFNGNSFSIKVKLRMLNSNVDLGFFTLSDSQKEIRKGREYGELYPKQPDENNPEDFGKVVEVNMKGSKISTKCENTLTIKIKKYEYILDVYTMVNNKSRIPDNGISHDVYVNDIKISYSSKSYCDNSPNPLNIFKYNSSRLKNELILQKFQYLIAGGENVKIIPILNQSKYNKAILELGNWLCSDELISEYLYLSDEPCYTQNICNSVNPDKEISFVMTHNSHVIHQFKQDFAITAIGLMKMQGLPGQPDNNEQEVWSWFFSEYGPLYPGYNNSYPTGELNNLFLYNKTFITGMNIPRLDITYPSTIRNYANIVPDYSFKTTAVKVVTNEYINPSSVMNNLNAKDDTYGNNIRYDKENLTTYNSNGFNTNISNNVITFTLFNTQNLEPCHMTEIQLNVLSGLTSVDNNVLINNFSGSFLTEYPNLYIEVNQNKFHHLSGNVGYGYYYYLGTNAYYMTNQEFKRTRFLKTDNTSEKLPRTGEDQYFHWILFPPMGDYSLRTINNDVPIVTYGRILPNETIELGYTVYSRCGNSGSARPEWLTTLKNGIVDAVFTNNADATAFFGAYTAVAVLISKVLVSALIGEGCWLCPQPRDDYILTDNNIYFNLNNRIWNTDGFYRRKANSSRSSSEELYYHIYIK